MLNVGVFAIDVMILSRGLIKKTKAEKINIKYSYSFKVCILIRGCMIMEVLLKTVNPFPC